MAWEVTINFNRFFWFLESSALPSELGPYSGPRFVSLGPRVHVEAGTFSGTESAAEIRVRATWGSLGRPSPRAQPHVCALAQDRDRCHVALSQG